MKQTVYLLLPIAFILMAVAPGCYTVIMHPSDEGSYRTREISDCSRCHDYSSYPYGYYYSPYPSYWWNYDNYGYYYAYPWWWEYGNDGQIDGDGNFVSSRPDTKFDRREVRDGPMPPPHAIPDGGDWDGLPGLYNIPVTTGPGSDNSDNGSIRPPIGTGTNSSGTRSKSDGTGSIDSKETRQSSDRSQPVSSGGEVTNPVNPPRDNPPADNKDTGSGRKKERRGGGTR